MIRAIIEGVVVTGPYADQFAVAAGGADYGDSPKRDALSYRRLPQWPVTADGPRQDELPVNVRSRRPWRQRLRRSS
jgi:hypothetical protein